MSKVGEQIRLKNRKYIKNVKNIIKLKKPDLLVIM